jgi:Segregation and condensation complex subunit ScpB
MLALSAIAYQQPVTRAELSRLAGHDISRDIRGRLKSLGVIAPGPRAPEPGAPIAWVTTARFLEMFALGSLRDLPDLDMLEDAGARGRDFDDGAGAELDNALGLSEEECAEVEFDDGGRGLKIRKCSPTLRCSACKGRVVGRFSLEPLKAARGPAKHYGPGASAQRTGFRTL